MADQDVAKAVLVGRLLIDWQLDQPMYRAENQAAAQALGAGPWQDFATLVYDDALDAGTALSRGIAVLQSIQDEPWATYLYLRDLYLPALERLTPEQLEVVRPALAKDLLRDPRDALTAVRCPVLAVFGEVDVVQPTLISAARYRQYLGEAGNDDVTVVIIPGVGHDIDSTTSGYAQALTGWLERFVTPTTTSP